MQMQTSTLQKQLNGLWTVRQLAKKVNRTTMTITNWRTSRGLPALKVPGDRRSSIRFVPRDVKNWARQQGVKIS